MTQEELACSLQVDPHTIHSWETGRRALTATNTGNFIRLQHKLATLGIRPLLLGSLWIALEADHVFDHVLGTDDDTQRAGEHPFGACLMPSSLSEMIAWPLTGAVPSHLKQVITQSRRGPVATHPSLPPLDRQRFFDRLRIDADRALPLRDQDRHHAVLGHQACFRVAWDMSPATQQWLDEVWRREVRSRGFDHWSPTWLAVRSLAIARARRGDAESLSDFVAAGHSSDVCETANLNYWAYWAGELPAIQTSNEFMMNARLLHSWTGVKVLPRLAEALDVENSDFVLNLHSTAVLIKRPVTADILDSEPELYASLRAKLEAAHDRRAGLSPAASRELADVLKALRRISPSMRPTTGRC